MTQTTRWKTNERDTSRFCSCLQVSPCDGRILHFGKVDCGRIEQVKGVSYSLLHSWAPRRGSRKSPAKMLPECSLEMIRRAEYFHSQGGASTRHIDCESYWQSNLEAGRGDKSVLTALFISRRGLSCFHFSRWVEVHFRQAYGGETNLIVQKLSY